VSNQVQPDREVLLIAHAERQVALDSARQVAARFAGAGVGVRVLDSDAATLALPGARACPAEVAADGVEMALVLGGDGSLLRGAELVRPWSTPLLGVNLGHVGFLAEAEQEDLDLTVDKVLAGSYRVEERMTLDVRAEGPDGFCYLGWALNEVSVEKQDPARMIDCLLEIDGRPLSRWACDGVVFATPTGSTAYAFSAGGPVVWPDVEALLAVPICAHALFARPLLASPKGEFVLDVLGRETAVISCDGRRSAELPRPCRVSVVRGAEPVRLARLRERSFTDRLVAKFDLPVAGWRGRRD
jgi:NAD+ kinase